METKVVVEEAQTTRASHPMSTLDMGAGRVARRTPAPGMAGAVSSPATVVGPHLQDVGRAGVRAWQPPVSSPEYQTQPARDADRALAVRHMGEGRALVCWGLAERHLGRARACWGLAERHLDKARVLVFWVLAETHPCRPLV